MPDRRALIYVYDGSFEGLLCCVFESYEKNEMPMDVLAEGAVLPLLLPVEKIETNEERAKRVKTSCRKKMGYEVFDFIRHAYLTCHPQKEILLLDFFRLGYKYGPSVLNRLADETVHKLYTAVEFLKREANHYEGFIRFSETNRILTSVIEPKNIVLPLIARHFCERFPNERFLIYDKTNAMALIHEGKKVAICGADDYEQPFPDEDEIRFRELWRLFYDTIEIKERHNPRCQMSHMPKRYWHCMTEFARDESGAKSQRGLSAAKTACAPGRLPSQETLPEAPKGTEKVPLT